MRMLIQAKEIQVGDTLLTSYENPLPVITKITKHVSLRIFHTSNNTTVVHEKNVRLEVDRPDTPVQGE